MKFLILNQVIGMQSDISEVAINRDMIKWMLRSTKIRPKTTIAMVGSDKTLEVLETIEDIERMCHQDVQLVTLVKRGTAKNICKTKI